MSFSVYFIGHPEKVANAVEEYSGKLTGQSKQEYDAAVPHIKGLVLQNVGANKVISVEANGHASFNDGVVTESNLNCSITAKYGLVV